MTIVDKVTPGTSAGHNQLCKIMAPSSGSIDTALPVPSDGINGQKIILFPAEKLRLRWQRIQKVGAGLQNLGNTCFVNSVLQCLTYTAPLANYLLTREHSKTCREQDFCMMCVMEAHIAQALSNSGNIIKPTSVINDLRRIAKHFRYGSQEDAHEFLRYTVDEMQKCCLKGWPSLDRHAQTTTFIHQIFGGNLRSRVQCLNCRAVSDTYDEYLDIPLEIKKVLRMSSIEFSFRTKESEQAHDIRIKTAAFPNDIDGFKTTFHVGINSHSINKALEQFVKAEELDGDNAYNCSKCKQMVTATKTFTIHRVSNVLTLSLKRFASFTGGKLSKEIKYPEYLDLKGYTSYPNGDPLIFKLYGVLVHTGLSCHSGHYYSYIRASNDRWYLMNDSVVTSVDLRTVLNQQAYLLFYIRCQSVHTGDGLESSSPNTAATIQHENKNAKHMNGNRSPKTLNGSVVNGLMSVNTLAKKQKITIGTLTLPSAKPWSTQSTSSVSTPLIQKQPSYRLNREPLVNGRSKISPNVLVPYGTESSEESEEETKGFRKRRWSGKHVNGDVTTNGHCPSKSPHSTTDSVRTVASEEEMAKTSSESNTTATNDLASHEPLVFILSEANPSVMTSSIKISQLTKEVAPAVVQDDKTAAVCKPLSTGTAVEKINQTTENMKTDLYKVASQTRDLQDMDQIIPTHDSMNHDHNGILSPSDHVEDGQREAGSSSHRQNDHPPLSCPLYHSENGKNHRYNSGHNHKDNSVRRSHGSYKDHGRHRSRSPGKIDDRYRSNHHDERRRWNNSRRYNGHYTSCDYRDYRDRVYYDSRDYYNRDHRTGWSYHSKERGRDYGYRQKYNSHYSTSRHSESSYHGKVNGYSNHQQYEHSKKRRLTPTNHTGDGDYEPDYKRKAISMEKVSKKPQLSNGR